MALPLPARLLEARGPVMIVVLQRLYGLFLMGFIIAIIAVFVSVACTHDACEGYPSQEACDADFRRQHEPGV